MPILLCCVLALGQLGGPSTSVAPAQPNILILVLDDLGVDNLAAYGLTENVPKTPNLDLLFKRGIRFLNAWSNPVCSPTRATIMSGRYSFRTGVEYTVVEGGTPLALREITLAELVNAGSPAYATGAFGKWHLGNVSVGGGWAPNLAGFDHYSGALRNLHPPETYFNWRKVTNGSSEVVNGYITTDTVDDVVQWIAGVDGPWLAYVGFHAVHTPYHAPPAALHSVDLSTAGDPTVDSRPYFEAMLEALDTEIGRLMIEAEIDLDDTYVLVVGDNGTEMQAIVPPFSPTKGKGTAYQGGVHVPLLVAGPAVAEPGATSAVLVNTSDIHATVAELAGLSLSGNLLGASMGPTHGGAPPGTIVGPPALFDSVSLVPYLLSPDRPSIRTYALAELVQKAGTPQAITRRAVRNKRFKLIMREVPPDPLEFEFYDLKLDPFETQDLLLGALTGDQQLVFDDLLAKMQSLTN